MKALVVDDSGMYRGIMKAVLQEAGFGVSEAKDGIEALEVLHADSPFQVALLDINMPRMNGYELLKKIRAERQYDDLPLVMVTTESETSQVRRVLASGANGYLVKPLDPDALVLKLRSLGLIDHKPKPQ